MTLSPSLVDKINARFVNDADVGELISKARSAARFDSQQEFANHLFEGSLLNVSVIGSKALSVPCGEYMVWMTDAGHTVLFPTGKSSDREVFENNREHYEVQTRDLMANWNKIERVLAEDSSQDDYFENEQDDELEDEDDNEFEDGDPDEDKANEFTSKIDASTVDRTPIMRAMQDRGYTVTSLADEVGVDPPAISRILRTPKDVQGDPGGRNPSMGLASQICNALRIDPTSAFPDIFSADKYEARNSPGNVGSGDHGHHGKGEVSKLNESIEIMEAVENCRVLCEMVDISKMPFNVFWENILWPSLSSINKNTSLNEFIDKLRHHNILTEWWFTDKNAKNAKNTKSAVADYQQRGFDNFAADAERIKSAADKMNKAIMPSIKQAFKDTMDQLKHKLQQAQLDVTIANPKLAPHAWEIINRFYKTVMQAGQNYAPQWKLSDNKQTRYDAAYQKARSDFEQTRSHGQAQPQAVSAPQPAQQTPAAQPDANTNT